MGGRGSGRRSSYCGKPETNDSMPLDIRKLARAGALVPGRSFGWQWLVNNRQVAGISIRVDLHLHSMVLAYRVKSTGELVEQQLHTQTSRCYLGGERCWFTCPQCIKRVAVLYAPGRYFAAASATDWATPRRKKAQATAHPPKPTNCASAWAGRLVFLMAMVADPKVCTGRPTTGSKAITMRWCKSACMTLAASWVS